MKADPLRITVVVPAYDDGEAVLRLLRALDQQAAVGDGELTVVVSDDGSPTPLERPLREASFDALTLDVVRSTLNGGPGAARNRGLAHVATEWVVLIDADELPGEGWLERLRSTTDAADAPDGVEGLLELDTRPSPFEHVAVSDTALRGVQHVAGNVAFRTSVLREVGGFDEAFYDARRKIHFREDVDLFFRLHDAGKRIVKDELLVARHPPLRWSFTSPMKHARRYHFDALLSRKHPQRFRELVRARRIGRLSLRRARHDACVMLAVGSVGGMAALILRSPRLGKGSAAVSLVGWAASATALSWKRRVTPRDLLPLATASAVVPWIYLWHYYRGVIRFRHWPRLS